MKIHQDSNTCLLWVWALWTITSTQSIVQCISIQTMYISTNKLIYITYLQYRNTMKNIHIFTLSIDKSEHGSRSAPGSVRILQKCMHQVRFRSLCTGSRSGYVFIWWVRAKASKAVPAYAKFNKNNIDFWNNLYKVLILQQLVNFLVAIKLSSDFFPRFKYLYIVRKQHSNYFPFCCSC